MEQDDSWRVIEFYSGIGGLRYSLMKASVNAKVVEAFDINNNANDVYEYNFAHRPHQGNVQSLTVAEIDCHQAHAWLLSPPCQPYTRQGLQKGSDDARAFSFLKILGLIPNMLNPPILLFVENVVGFEVSDTHERMVNILQDCDFVLQEFILSPLDFGVPYSRPRYFCLAKRKPFPFSLLGLNSQLLGSHELFLGLDGNKLVNGCGRKQARLNKMITCEPLEKFLEPLWNLDQYLVPENLIKRWGTAMDIVYPNSLRSCCFTKSYYRYVKGTGSLLAMSEPMNVREGSSCDRQNLRYFTPREVANLHSFPEEFDFPQHITLRQRYALLGNSISVAVVAALLQYLFSEPCLSLAPLSISKVDY